MRLYDIYNKHQQRARRKELTGFSDELRALVNSARRQGLSDNDIASELEDVLSSAQLGEAYGEAEPVDARKLAKALVQVARQNIPEVRMQLGAALQMADNLNRRVKEAIKQIDQETTWV